MTALMAAGQPSARQYPLWRLVREYDSLQTIERKRHAVTASLLQHAVASVLSEDAAESFGKRIKTLIEGST